MKRRIIILLLIVAAFCSGFALNAFFNAKQRKLEAAMKKATGIGGIFFKCKDPKALKEWYKTHLGLNVDKYGAVFEWRQGEDTTRKGFTQWSPFKETTKYFEPSTKEFMINYRVENLTTLVAMMKSKGVNVVDTIETYNYGKFVHVMDPEGNKLELWEPNDLEYEKMGKEMGAKTTK